LYRATWPVSPSEVPRKDQHRGLPAQRVGIEFLREMMGIPVPAWYKPCLLEVSSTIQQTWCGVKPAHIRHHRALRGCTIAPSTGNSARSDTKRAGVYWAADRKASYRNRDSLSRYGASASDAVSRLHHTRNDPPCMGSSSTSST